MVAAETHPAPVGIEVRDERTVVIPVVASNELAELLGGEGVYVHHARLQLVPHDDRCNVLLVQEDVVPALRGSVVEQADGWHWRLRQPPDSTGTGPLLATGAVGYPDMAGALQALAAQFPHVGPSADVERREA